MNPTNGPTKPTINVEAAELINQELLQDSQRRQNAINVTTNMRNSYLQDQHGGQPNDGPTLWMFDIFLNGLKKRQTITAKVIYASIWIGLFLAIGIIFKSLFH